MHSINMAEVLEQAKYHDNIVNMDVITLTIIVHGGMPFPTIGSMKMWIQMLCINSTLHMHTDFTYPYILHSANGRRADN